jgi:hypothetical protein
MSVASWLLADNASPSRLAAFTPSLFAERSRDLMNRLPDEIKENHLINSQ